MTRAPHADDLVRMLREIESLAFAARRDLETGERETARARIGRIRVIAERLPR